MSDEEDPFDGLSDFNDSDELNSSDEPEEQLKVEKKKTTNKKPKKRRKLAKNEFIDDEAELSGDDLVSEDELELSDDDEVDLALVDKDAKELDSDEEEEVRGLYLKQLETEDRRAVLLLQEQLEDNNVSLGQRRRRKFRWQTKELLENSLKRHYDPDDDDSQSGDDDGYDDYDLDELQPRLKRPTTEALLLGSTKITTRSIQDPEAGPSAALTDDSNSNTMNTRLSSTKTQPTVGVANITTDMNRFVYRDKQLVEALSTRETVIVSREEKDRVIQRELKRVLQSKSIFDQLYS